VIKQLAGMPGVRADRFSEARTPRHAALSLVGEPVMFRTPFRPPTLAPSHLMYVCDLQKQASSRSLLLFVASHLVAAERPYSTYQEIYQPAHEETHIDLSSSKYLISHGGLALLDIRMLIQRYFCWSRRMRNFQTRCWTYLR
jgi:hypothetical protein